MTRLGATPGTPAYMAPEQFTGQDTDARSDQFSFCVMLWEALFGERPFAGASMLDLAAAVLEGNLRAPPRGANVPYWLRRVVERGLATDPDDRFASMPALLKGLRGGRTIARARRTAAAVVAMAIAGVGGLAMTRYDRGQRIAACEAAGATIDEVWNDDQRGAVRAALLASGAGHAATTADKLIPWLDAQASAWRRARSDACLDVYVHRVWDADTLERSVWCLDDRRFELDALVTELKAADVEAVTRAVPAAAGLQQVDPCRDRALVERSPAPPTEGRDAVQAVRAGLSRARALQATGAYAQGLQVANESLLRAQALGWPPLVATAELDVGVLQDANGAYADAESMLESAYFDAATAGATEDALSAAQQLVYTTGSRLARHGDGERWSRHAEVLRAALPDPARLREATSLNNLANVRHASGAYEEAATLHEGALAIREQALGPAHPDVASSLNNVAVVRYTMGAYDEAATLHERVFAIRQKVLGLDHPDVAVTLNNLAAVRYATGAFEEAAALYERALAIRERALGREHPDVATSLNSLAVVRNATGAYEEARTLLERALPIRRKASGAEHPLVATLLNNLAIGRHGVGAYNEAAILHERALAIREKTLGPDHPDVANSLANLAAVHNAAEAYEQAMALYERALAIREKTLGPDHPSVAQPLIGLAKVALAQGRHSEAVVLAERAAKLRGADDVPVTELAQARMVLARALAESRRDPGRAVLLAEQARDAYRDAGDAYRDEAAEAEALLRDHEGGP